MKKHIAFMLLVTLFAVPAFAQGPVCNEERAEGIARSQLGQCIAAAIGPNVDVEVTALCECPAFGISVLAIGRVRCVQLDCDYNVISATCF
jgi:hypothetical protein